MDLELGRTPPARERADAARNRVKILDAAARLFFEQGIENVSMDAVAAAAGVGKGTLFRRFGDKAGLAVALLDERERALQELVLSGPPPLGPGTQGPGGEGPGGEEPGGEALGGEGSGGAAERLHAFVDAYLTYLLDHLHLVRMSETASPGARYKVGAYRFWHRHVTILLGEGSEALAHTLLAGLAADHVVAVLDDLGSVPLRRALHRVVDGIT